MNELIFFLFYMPAAFYFALAMMLCCFYFLIVAPIIFRFFVIPKIEYRLKVNLNIVDPICYYNYLIFYDWLLPPLEISAYVICKYLKKEIKGVRNPKEGTYFYKLKENNYDINYANSFEINISLITAFILFTFLTSSVLFFLYR